MNDPDYSPAYQDEYQRLWHEAAASAQILENERNVALDRITALEAERGRLREALTALMSLMYPFAYPNNPDPLVSGAAVAQWTSVIEAALAPEQEQG